MNNPRILAFSGSARAQSFNQRLVENAARAAEDAGAGVLVAPEQAAISSAGSAFDAHGVLIDESNARRVTTVSMSLVRLLTKLR